VVINRDRKEFHARAGLQEIIAAAGLPPFNEIPYLQLERYPPDLT
jgi:hypothetical protein